MIMTTKYDRNLYQPRKLDATRLTLKPNATVAIKDAHPDVIALAYKHTTGPWGEDKSAQQKRLALARYGFRFITANNNDCVAPVVRRPAVVPATGSPTTTEVAGIVQAGNSVLVKLGLEQSGLIEASTTKLVYTLATPVRTVSEGFHAYLGTPKLYQDREFQVREFTVPASGVVRVINNPTLPRAARSTVVEFIKF